VIARQHAKAKLHFNTERTHGNLHPTEDHRLPSAYRNGSSAHE
jgi:hypothetical protein